MDMVKRLTRKMRGWLFVAVVLISVSCTFEHPDDVCFNDTNSFFEGCFEGDISAPVGTGRIQVVLNHAGFPETRLMAGCTAMSLANGSEIVTLSGEVQCGGTTAKLQGLRANSLTLTLIVRRLPDLGNAVAVDVSTEDGMPFATALALQRCELPVSGCQDFGMRVPFG